MGAAGASRIWGSRVLLHFLFLAVLLRVHGVHTTAAADLASADDGEERLRLGLHLPPRCLSPPSTTHKYASTSAFPGRELPLPSSFVSGGRGGGLVLLRCYLLSLSFFLREPPFSLTEASDDAKEELGPLLSFEAVDGTAASTRSWSSCSSMILLLPRFLLFL
jgi:hypothetical protein